MFLSAMLRWEFQLLHPLLLFYVLTAVSFVASIIGKQILKKNSNDTYARLGFIINVTPISIIIILSIVDLVWGGSVKSFFNFLFDLIFLNS